MARRHPYRNCKGCGKPREEEEGGLLSARGWCKQCGQARSDTNALHLSAREGEFYEHFLRRRFMTAYARILELEKAS